MIQYHQLSSRAGYRRRVQINTGVAIPSLRQRKLNHREPSGLTGTIVSEDADVIDLMW